MALASLFLIAALLLAFLPGFLSGLRSLARDALDAARATIDRGGVVQYNKGEHTNIIFLHHSTGKNLIDQGRVREQLAGLGYSFWDHGYNFEGLRDPDANPAGYSYDVPGDNTDPDGMARIFGQRIYPLPLNTISGLMQHEVILFKSCFDPTSKIISDEQLADYQGSYLEVRETIDRHPEKVFVLLTQPPLNPAETNPQEASRARELADWLSSGDFLGGRENLYVFNLFGHLAEADPNTPDFNMLRSDYRNGSDSHPNRLANQEIGPLFVEFIHESIDHYQTALGEK